ncbi:hypothetical protein OG455_19885 [Kitasatospora sp. NBC_01287]|uniref:hypothetical protein n=1 Tax=Kitasatospora sp. NBC_01287 TaxID=2903573 RepID=UPI0022530DBA|nr:hypothetical protein [Kitasatospora sp. NBC_01287]MCX4747748.1 hypothetical protein [Kitasatospora sp. NBC_01287]
MEGVPLHEIITELRAGIAALEIELDPQEDAALRLAEHHLRDAAHCDDQVRADGRLIAGGTRHSVMVAHPLIAEARQLRAEAGRLIARVRLPAYEPPASRSNAARSLAAHRWGQPHLTTRATPARPPNERGSRGLSSFPGPSLFAERVASCAGLWRPATPCTETASERHSPDRSTRHQHPWNYVEPDRHRR